MGVSPEQMAESIIEAGADIIGTELRQRLRTNDRNRKGNQKG